MNLKAFIQLIRFDNLLFITLTMLLCRYCFIAPLLKLNHPALSTRLSTTDFFLLVVSTLFIAAAGYIINDYFDVKADRINKPERLYIDNGVKRRVAIFIHTIFNIIGFTLALYVSYKTGKMRLGLIALFSITLLWFYSTWLKKKVLVGNVVVSLLSALVPLQILFFEIPLLERFYGVDLFQFTYLYLAVFAFAGFAFLLSMIREIIKDMEDVEGDLLAVRKTIPIAWGMKASKAMIAGLISNTLLLLLFIFFKLITTHIYSLLIYLFIAVFIPLIFLIWKIYRSHSKAEYHKLSSFTKYIMIAGVCSTLLIYLYVNGFSFQI